MQCGRVLGAQDAAAEKPGEGENADDEALSVATDCETYADGDEHDVEEVHYASSDDDCDRGWCRRCRIARRKASPERSSTRPWSHGLSQAPSASNRSSTAAVKPQTNMSATSNAGPLRPLGWRICNRLAGSARSLIATRATAATSCSSA